MKLVLFYHSLASDWNHGNAHFLRGIVTELLAAGHSVHVYEPADGWSLKHLLAEQGQGALAAFRRAYPELASTFYSLGSFDVERALDGADVVIVHEWNPPELVARVGRAARAAGCIALFHDTHHRSVSDPAEIAALDLSEYAGVLAFGEVIRQRYLENGWTRAAWTWHEAADLRRFRPLADRPRLGDLVWIGNWGDDERSAELDEFLIQPVARLGLAAHVHGVRYPHAALAALAAAGIAWRGWLPNHRVPEVFASFGCTVHVPRRAYNRLLPGIPTIRVFEALACGIPLVTAPWSDEEGLFRPGDFLVARDGAHMTRLLDALRHDHAFASEVARNGRETVLQRHGCAHRMRELLDIVGALRGAHPQSRGAPARPHLGGSDGVAAPAGSGV